MLLSLPTKKQICRPFLFKESMRRYHVAWWAYSFPVTSLALASAEYAQEVEGGVTHVIMLILSGLSVLVILSLLVFTALNTKMLLRDDDPILPTSLPDHPLSTAWCQFSENYCHFCAVSYRSHQRSFTRNYWWHWIDIENMLPRIPSAVGSSILHSKRSGVWNSAYL